MYSHQIGRIVCGTGHRPNKLGGYDKSSENIVLSVAEKALKHHEPKLLISGMAQGWDMALAYAALLNRIPYVAAVPFKGQELKWSKESQKHYRYLLKNANKVIYVNETYIGPWVMQERNEWMVKHSNTVLALWDGSETGGTYNCLKFAKKHKHLDKSSVDIINYWKVYETIKKGKINE